MLDLKPILAQVRNLLDEDSDSSITYAALEARLALEKVCYDRLRQRHDYIAHSELAKWQPSAVINRLLQDVDAHVGQTVSLYISKTPAVAGVIPDDDDFVEVGTEIGFNAKRIAKLWNALSSLALHVRLPENRDDLIAPYGNKDKTKAKVLEVLSELEHLASGTMAFSGFGEQVSFECSCGATNKRRVDRLSDGQKIHCINPECKTAWRALKEEDGFSFETITIPINCQECSAEIHIPWRWFLDIKYSQYGMVCCHECQHNNHVQWRLCLVSPKK